MPRDAEGQAGYRPAAAAVLADRLAAALVHHEPGWRLPRLTALARRYSVSSSEIDAAIDELAARHLVRRLPDGQVYRASPAEYWVPLEGVAGLVSRVDPMGGLLACASRHTTLRRPPEDIGRTLGLAPGASVLAVRCVWTVGREPAALVASYLPERAAAELGVVVKPGGEDAAAGSEGGRGGGWGAGLASPLAFPFGSQPATTQSPRPGAVQIEMGLPPPSAARTLRLAAGEPVATVTVSFTDPSFGAPVALTMAMLRPELFRIVIHAAPGPGAAGSADDWPRDWTHSEDCWDPQSVL